MSEQVKEYEGINTNCQFFNLIHSPEVASIISQIGSEVTTKLLSQQEEPSESVEDVLNDKFVQELELELKNRLNEVIKLKSTSGRRVRILTKASVTDGRPNISIYPRWLPRPKSFFKNQSEQAAA